MCSLCLSVGVVKTQWYNAWITTNTLRKRTDKTKKPRELDQIHQYLQAFEMPDWVARLPNQVGYPAGGSLGADEWKCMAMAYCPIVVRQVPFTLSNLLLMFRILGTAYLGGMVSHRRCRKCESTGTLGQEGERPFEVFVIRQGQAR